MRTAAADVESFLNRFGQYSTHELADTPDAYDAHLEVDFSVLGEDEAQAA